MDSFKAYTRMFNAMKAGDHVAARQLALSLEAWFEQGAEYPLPVPCDEMESYIHSVLYRTSPDEVQVEFTLACEGCDDGDQFDSPEEAMDEGWTVVDLVEGLDEANYLGTCANCQLNACSPHLLLVIPAPP